MKTTLLSVLLALVVLGLLAFVGLRLREPPAAAMQDGAAWSRMAERLDRLERSLDRLADLEQEVARLSSREAPAAGEPSADAGPGSPAGETAAAETPAGEVEVAKGPSKFDRWLDANDMRGDMEGFVAQVYEQARKARMKRESEEAEARQREMQELSEGPYGRHNYRVNLLTKRLDLDSRQAAYLYNLLTQYDERLSGLKRERELIVPEGTKPTPEQLEQHFQHVAQTSKALREGLEADFVSRLNAEQEEAYGELPEEDKVASPAAEKMVYVRRAADVMAIQGAKLLEAAATPQVAPPPPPGR